MAGGFEAALERAESEIDAFAASAGVGTSVVDLGAGFGAHAIALAARGCAVLAVDSSAWLLEQLRSRSVGLSIRAVHADLLDFERHLDAAPDLVLCLGDTLTHLPDRESVSALLAAVAHVLRPGGRFVATFRDYSAPLVGERRFIPVRSDADRILTCFLEYADEHVTVHDLLYEREGERWPLRVSAYPKLRLPPDRVADALVAAGLDVHREVGQGGMVRIVAGR